MAARGNWRGLCDAIDLAVSALNGTLSIRFPDYCIRLYTLRPLSEVGLGKLSWHSLGGRAVGKMERRGGREVWRNGTKG